MEMNRNLDHSKMFFELRKHLNRALLQPKSGQNDNLRKLNT